MAITDSQLQQVCEKAATEAEICMNKSVVEVGHEVAEMFKKAKTRLFHYTKPPNPN